MGTSQKFDPNASAIERVTIPPKVSKSSKQVSPFPKFDSYGALADQKRTPSKESKVPKEAIVEEAEISPVCGPWKQLDVQITEKSSTRILEARFRPTVELVHPEVREKVTPVNPEFPLCPECRTKRYWVSAGGKVVCGKCGKVRFLLAAIEFHAVY